MNEPILIVDRENFNEILSGKKKEEYRSVTEYYTNILCIKEKGEYVGFKPIKAVWFALGYAKDRKMLKVEIKSIHGDMFIDFIPEGFKKGDEAFTLDLGSIIDSVNV